MDASARLEDLPTPALLLDLDVLESNLRRMAEKTRRLGVRLRPHLKTHKCVEIAELQRSFGAEGFTVSTLYEARVFAEHGFEDLTWAFPLVFSRISEAVELAGRTRLGLTVDSPEAVRALEETGRSLRVWLKVDCGYGRAGVDPRSSEAVALARALHTSSSLAFAGLLSHAGHTYAASSVEEIARIAEEERAVMVSFARRLEQEGIPVPEVSVGSTPGMARVRRLDGVTEVRPGNYALHDGDQVTLGTCTERDCAVTVLTSVVSSPPGSGRSVVDAGALALSKDTGRTGEAYGRILADGTAEWHGAPGGARVVSVSQEHGILDRAFPVGTRLRILPNHSCLAVACFDAYDVVRGGRPAGRWKIWRGR